MGIRGRGGKAEVSLGMWSLLGGWLLAAASLASAGPITYDQRQEGPLNVHVQLDNLAVLLVPTASLMDPSWVTQLAAMGRTPGGHSKDQANQISSAFNLVPESVQVLLQKAPVPSKVFEGPPEGVPTPQLVDALNVSKTDAMEPLKKKVAPETPASTTLLAESSPVSLLTTKQVLTSPQVLPDSETPSRDAIETGLRRP
jgi:hypothetical protein